MIPHKAGVEEMHDATGFVKRKIAESHFYPSPGGDTTMMRSTPLFENSSQ
jgi:hypothetical protein